MGIFKDLGFKNRDGKISAPSAEKFAGYTLDEVKNQINPTFVYVDSAVDGQAVISGTSLPTKIAQDASWVKYQPVAYGFSDDGAVTRKLFINDVEQVIVSEEPGVVGGSTVDTLNILNDNSCIATYKLDGNVNDLSGNYNGSVTAGTITYPYGVFDKCASFNGSARITHIIEPTDAFSVSFWAYFNNNDTNSLLFDFGNGYMIYRYLLADSRIRAQYKGAPGNNTSTTINHKANTWNHFVVNFTSTNVSMYVDGVLQINTVWDNYINSYGKTIGMRSDNWGAFNGQLDQIRVFNKVLSQSEIITLYNENTSIKGKTTFETSLVNNVNELSIRNEGLVDSVEINFYEGV